MKELEEIAHSERQSQLQDLPTELFEDGYDEEAMGVSIEQYAFRIHEHIEEVFFRIKDYLYEQSERELLQNLTMYDVACLLYEPRHIDYLLRDVASFQL